MRIVTKNVKRIVLVLCACVIFIMPFISWGGGTAKEAKADTTDTVYNFRGSNLTFASAYFDFGVQGTLNSSTQLWSNNYVLAKANYYYSGSQSRTVSISETKVGGRNSLGPLVYLAPKTPAYSPSNPYQARPDNFLTFEFALLGSADSSDLTICYNLVYSTYSENPSSMGLDIYYDINGYLNPRPVSGSNRQLIDSFGAIGSTVRVNSQGYSFVYFCRAPSDEFAQNLLIEKSFVQPGGDCQGVMRFYKSSNSFVPNISRVEIGNVSGSDISNDDYFMTSLIYLASYSGYGLYRLKYPYNYVRYYDTNNNYLEIAIPYFPQWEYDFSHSVKWDTRTYYLSEYVSDVDNYELGKAAGIKEGEANKEAAIKAAVDANSVEWAGIVNERVAAELELAKDIVYNEGFQAGANKSFGFGMFMSSMLDVLNIPIFGDFGLGDMFMVVFGVSIVLVVLKIFAGG